MVSLSRWTMSNTKAFSINDSVLFGLYIMSFCTMVSLSRWTKSNTKAFSINDSIHFGLYIRSFCRSLSRWTMVCTDGRFHGYRWCTKDGVRRQCGDRRGAHDGGGFWRERHGGRGGRQDTRQPPPVHGQGHHPEANQWRSAQTRGRRSVSYTAFKWKQT